MSAAEHLERMFHLANEGAIARVGGRQAKSFQSSLDSLREKIDGLHFEIDHLDEKGDSVAFCYTARGEANGRPVHWTGSGVGKVRGNELHLVQLSEDYLRRRITLGDIDLDANPEDNITGTWKGSLFGIDFTMDLKQSPPSDRVTGSISVVGLSFDLSGTNDPPAVKLSGSGQGQTVTFEGKWVDANKIHGIINGAGIDNEQVTITR